MSCRSRSSKTPKSGATPGCPCAAPWTRTGSRCTIWAARSLSALPACKTSQESALWSPFRSLNWTVTFAANCSMCYHWKTCWFAQTAPRSWGTKTRFPGWSNSAPCPRSRRSCHWLALISRKSPCINSLRVLARSASCSDSRSRRFKSARSPSAPTGTPGTGSGPCSSGARSGSRTSNTRS